MAPTLRQDQLLVLVLTIWKIALYSWPTHPIEYIKSESEFEVKEYPCPFWVFAWRSGSATSGSVTIPAGREHLRLQLASLLKCDDFCASFLEILAEITARKLIFTSIAIETNG